MKMRDTSQLLIILKPKWFSDIMIVIRKPSP